MMGNSRIKCRNLAEVFTVSEIRYMQMDDKEFWYSITIFYIKRGK